VRFSLLLRQKLRRCCRCYLCQAVLAPKVVRARHRRKFGATGLAVLLRRRCCCGRAHVAIIGLAAIGAHATAAAAPSRGCFAGGAVDRRGGFARSRRRRLCVQGPRPSRRRRRQCGCWRAGGVRRQCGGGHGVWVKAGQARKLGAGAPQHLETHKRRRREGVIHEPRRKQTKKRGGGGCLD
jgi:hypothetical protein